MNRDPAGCDVYTSYLMFQGFVLVTFTAFAHILSTIRAIHGDFCEDGDKGAVALHLFSALSINTYHRPNKTKL